MPEESPPAVARFPSSTNLAPRLRWISGNSLAKETNAPRNVVAALPDKRPVFASTNAPVQTDMVTSVDFVDLRIHSSVASLGSLCAGITITFGAGAFPNVYSGTIFIPPLVWMGEVDSDTV